MTDLEEQKLLEEAQNGDPKAKYELSLWARQIAPLKPDEEKWNRLAAACLVDAAKAGYEPAVKMVQQLMTAEVPESKEAAEETAETVAEEIEEEPAETGYIFDRLFAGLDEEPVRTSSKNEPETASVEERPASEEEELLPGFNLEPEKIAPQVYVPYEDPGFADYEEPEETPLQPSFVDKAKKVAAGLIDKATFLIQSITQKKTPAAREEDGFEEEVRFAGDEAEESILEPAPESMSEEVPQTRAAAHAGKSGGNRMSRVLDWVGDNWSTVRIALIAVIAVMAILVVLLLLPKGTFQKAPEPTPTPVPATATPAPTPTPEPFPNEATRNEIAATAVLDYRPEEGEFLTASATYSVNSDDGMNMRSGPGTDYDVLVRLADEQKVTAYARHTTEEDTWYLVNTGGNWGWVISDYLQ